MNSHFSLWTHVFNVSAFSIRRMNVYSLLANSEKEVWDFWMLSLYLLFSIMTGLWSALIFLAPD